MRSSTATPRNWAGSTRSPATATTASVCSAARSPRRRGARETLDLGAGAGTVLQWAADAWADEAGGTSGALWGVALRAGRGSRRRRDAQTASPSPKAVRLATDVVQTVGKAKPGDKTMVDVLVPFSEALSTAVENGDGFDEASSHAAHVAATAAEQTAALTPRIGRARPLAARSIGTPDAGAVSLALIVRSVHDAIAAR